MKRVINIGASENSRFNLLVIGQSKCGKTSLLRNLLRCYVNDDDYSNINSITSINTTSTSTINTTSTTTGKDDITLWIEVKVTTNTGSVNLRVFTYPGYGDRLNNEPMINKIQKYLLSKHDMWSTVDGQMIQEKDRNFYDERIHCWYHHYHHDHHHHHHHYHHHHYHHHHHYYHHHY